jgi:hypothetical protein
MWLGLRGGTRSASSALRVWIACWRMHDVWNSFGSIEHSKETHWDFSGIEATVPPRSSLQKSLALFEIDSSSILKLDGERSLENIDITGCGMGHPFRLACWRNGKDRRGDLRGRGRQIGEWLIRICSGIPGHHGHGCVGSGGWGYCLGSEKHDGLPRLI